MNSSRGRIIIGVRSFMSLCQFHQFGNKFCLEILSSFIFLFFSKNMKRRSLYPAIAPFFVLLVLAVQDSQLMSPFGRRFGRSVGPKNSFQRSSQAYFTDQQTSSPSRHEQRAFQYSNERPLVIEKKQVDAKSVNNILIYTTT